MFIRRGERIARGASSRHSEWDDGWDDGRPPRNWFRVVRLILYGLTVLLAAVAALAAVALFLDRGSNVRPPGASPVPDQQTADATAPPADVPPAPVVPPGSATLATAPPDTAPAAPPPLATAPPPVPSAPAPIAAAPPPTAPPPTAPPADAKALAALADQLHNANSEISGLRSETEALRTALAELRQRQAASLKAASAPPAHTPAPRTEPPHAATPAAQMPATQAPQPPRPDWADAERTVQALAQHPAVAAPAQSAPPPTRGSTAGAAPASPAPAELASNAAPLTPPAGPPPRVFLHYPAGSEGGMREVTNIARRLRMTDFAYADTRSTTRPPAESVIRYFYPQDAAAATELASLLAGGDMTFRVQDVSARPGRAKPGTLEVWVGR